ncbi:MAG: hypothetical protein NEHIOOID_00828 [Holosporales bacterium]
MNTHFTKIAPFLITALIATDRGSESASSCEDAVLVAPSVQNDYLFEKLRELEDLRHGSIAEMQDAYAYYQRINIDALSDKNKNICLRGYSKTLIRLGLKEELRDLIDKYKKCDIYTLVTFADALMFSVGDERRAISIYKKVINSKLIGLSDFKARAHIGLGNAREGDRIKHYKHALRLTQDNELKAQAYIGLGNARADGVQIPHYRTALGLTQDKELKAQAHIGLGNARDENRIKHYKDALRLTQDNELKAQAYIGLGNARDGGVNNVNHYRAALELTQDNELKAQAHIGLGNARDENRIKHYKDALELTQDKELKAQAYIGLGNAREGDRIKHYKDALELTQDNELKAQAYVGLGNTRDGGVDNVNHYKEAIRLTQNNELKIQAYMGLGNAYASNKDSISALREFINAFNIGNLTIKQNVYALLERKHHYIVSALKQYTGEDKQQLQDWWDKTPDPR